MSAEHVKTIQCPRCNQVTAIWRYGGERGEAGPFLYCEVCDYDEESEKKEATFRQITPIVRQSYPDILRIAEAELVRLREFVQFVADHSNDPSIVKEARRHGAE